MTHPRNRVSSRRTGNLKCQGGVSRPAALRHALLSYVLGAVVLAITINLVCPGHERLEVSMEDAFRLLRRYAHTSEQRLTAVARRLIAEPDQRATIRDSIRQLVPPS